MFAPSSKSRTPIEELRELSDTRFRVADPDLLSRQALVHVAAARSANRASRRRILRAMAFYVAALGFLGAQALLVALVQLLGV